MVMISKPLHAGNIAVAFASVATAADLTFTGGVGAATRDRVPLNSAFT